MKLGYVINYVEDVTETLAFYNNVFGFKIRMEYKDNGSVLYGELETGGSILGVSSPQMGQMNLKGHYQKPLLTEPPFGQELAIVTSRVTETFKKAIDAGAMSVAEPVEKPWGQTVAYLRDPDGYLLELCTPMEE